jgi:hypothetical protein
MNNAGVNPRALSLGLDEPDLRSAAYAAARPLDFALQIFLQKFERRMRVSQSEKSRASYFEPRFLGALIVAAAKRLYSGYS